jgi:hypothetical protein
MVIRISSLVSIAGKVEQTLKIMKKSGCEKIAPLLQQNNIRREKMF